MNKAVVEVINALESISTPTGGVSEHALLEMYINEQNQEKKDFILTHLLRPLTCVKAQTATKAHLTHLKSLAKKAKTINNETLKEGARIILKENPDIVEDPILLFNMLSAIITSGMHGSSIYDNIINQGFRFEPIDDDGARGWVFTLTKESAWKDMNGAMLHLAKNTADVALASGLAAHCFFDSNLHLAAGRTTNRTTGEVVGTYAGFYTTSDAPKAAMEKLLDGRTPEEAVYKALKMIRNRLVENTEELFTVALAMSMGFVISLYNSAVENGHAAVSEETTWTVLGGKS